MTEEEIRNIVAKAFEQVVFPHDNVTIAEADWNELRDSIAELAAKKLVEVTNRLE